MLAKDIMTSDVFSVTMDTSVKDVARLMVEKKISGVPVVNNEGHLIGMVTESDLLVRAKKLDLPAFLPLLGGYIYLENPAKLDEEMRKVTATRADQIMTKRVFSVTPDKPLTEIATLMTERNVNRVPVVENEKIIGIITRGDVIRAIAAEME